MFGNRWEKVEAQVPGRNRRQCKDHWNRVLSKKEVARHVSAQNIAVKNAASVIGGGRDFQLLSDEEDGGLAVMEAQRAAGLGVGSDRESEMDGVMESEDEDDEEEDEDEGGA
ncbi:hypothetical protein HK101_010445 [Irineochytrium annulatum]|nr:hypothetical protein HK101_010445 [Irineochytrium annulatum]